MRGIFISSTSSLRTAAPDGKQHLARCGVSSARNGRKDEQRGSQEGRRAVRASSLRYDGNEYFWINNMTPKKVMHPIKPAKNGRDLSPLKHPN